ncbi:MAG: orotate phosphoribosyltransferase [Thermoplasmata archaeon]|nr:MAG: orotate phosphoribosyltransferase [Thermoplasmata archaeon]
MELLGLCNICGKPDAVFTCRLCGSLVCRSCFDPSHGICNRCKMGKQL